jgi:hypothetical protein
LWQRTSSRWPTTHDYQRLPVRTRTWSGSLSDDFGTYHFTTKLREFYLLVYHAYKRRDRPAPQQLVAFLPYVQGAFSLGGGSDPKWWHPGSMGRVLWVVDQGNLDTADAPPHERRVAFALAHELGHNMGLRHPGAADPGCPAATDSDAPANYWPYADHLGTIHEPGADPLTRRLIPPSYHDIMTHCPPPNLWISPHHYQMLFEANMRPQAMLDLAQPRLAAPLAAPGEVLIVSGWVQADGQVGHLDPPFRVASDQPTDPPDPEGNYCLRIANASSQIGDYCFTLRFQHPDTAAPLPQEPFVVALPVPPDTQRLALVRRGVAAPGGTDDRELAALTASANPPTVAVTSPQPGQTWQGTQTVTWSASDADGDALTYLVLASTDGGESWYPLDLDMGSTQPGYAVYTADIAASDQVMFRVLASDGLHTTQADAGPISVPEQGFEDLPATDAAPPPPTPYRQPTADTTAPTAAPLAAVQPSPTQVAAPPAAAESTPGDLAAQHPLLRAVLIGGVWLFCSISVAAVAVWMWLSRSRRG